MRSWLTIKEWNELKKCLIDKAWNKLMIMAQRSIECNTFNQNCSFIRIYSFTQFIKTILPYISRMSSCNFSFVSVLFLTRIVSSLFLSWTSSQRRQGWNINLFLVFIFLLHIIHFLSSSYSFASIPLTCFSSLTLSQSPSMDDYCQYKTNEKKPLVIIIIIVSLHEIHRSTWM